MSDPLTACAPNPRWARVPTWAPLRLYLLYFGGPYAGLSLDAIPAGLLALSVLKNPDGSITANWDGQLKHRTVIADGARLGSGTILVAPVEVGEGAYTGAGSVITGDVPDGALAVARSRQRNILGWVARRRAKGAPGAEDGG